ncbi:pyrroline-5-carboxylate reductase [Phenylobacterium sp.]|uniref:pyrroline-5-carboxylate reductase n=1 Tax=Phenylobacterium sp. TaxID=1871053 RepID=UPI002730BB72|nr:pyrroline-5-carboxylate reductase [Phenylobacterium sp.]MDP1616284.1 pyrroline-5-carboxylate reductase [Phenylobacterium sp.]MDP1987358.1 pyrroline-5-carboxylate reductase [Phenylobacterium sp.]
MGPLLMLGAGRMGGALISGWRRAGLLSPADLMIRDPYPGDEAKAAIADGARHDPDMAAMGRAEIVLLAVKPQLWREAAGEVSQALAADAIIVSIAAGVPAAEISKAFGGRAVARIMPTTAAAIGQGTASLYATDARAGAQAKALFAAVGAVVELTDEDLMHAATAVSGSAPAYLYAFVEALEAAGGAAGLPPEQAQRLARATIAGAAALLADSGEEPAELRKQVTSPGGTTQAALEVLMGEGGLGPLLEQAVAAATRRSRELGA